MNIEQASILNSIMTVASIVSLFRTDDTDTELYPDDSVSVSGLVELPVVLREALNELGVIVDDDGRGLLIPSGM